MIALIQISDYWLARALGSSREAREGPYLAVEAATENSPVILFWPLDPKLVEEARAI
jgi:hypothetical protein